MCQPIRDATAGVGSTSAAVHRHKQAWLQRLLELLLLNLPAVIALATLALLTRKDYGLRGGRSEVPASRLGGTWGQGQGLARAGAGSRSPPPPPRSEAPPVA
jgi:hypothetical protein